MGEQRGGAEPFGVKTPRSFMAPSRRAQFGIRMINGGVNRQNVDWTLP